MIERFIHINLVLSHISCESFIEQLEIERKKEEI